MRLPACRWCASSFHPAAGLHHLKGSFKLKVACKFFSVKRVHNLPSSPQELSRLLQTTPLSQFSSNALVKLAKSPWISIRILACAYLTYHSTLDHQQTIFGFSEASMRSKNCPSPSSSAPRPRSRPDLQVLQALLHRVVHDLPEDMDLADSVLQLAYQALDPNTSDAVLPIDIMNSLLASYFQYKQFHRAESLLKHHIKKPNSSTIHAIMRHAACGPDMVFKILTDLQSKFQVPDDNLNVLQLKNLHIGYWLVHACLKSPLRVKERQWSEWQSNLLSKIIPNAATGRNIRNWRTPIESFERSQIRRFLIGHMRTPRSLPLKGSCLSRSTTTRNHNQPLTACSIHPQDFPHLKYDTRQDWSTAQDVLDKLFDMRQADSSACHLLLAAYARQGQITRAERLLHKMREHRLVDAHTIALIMKAYCTHWRAVEAASRTEQLNASWNLPHRERGFRDIRELWLEIDNLQKRAANAFNTSKASVSTAEVDEETSKLALRLGYGNINKLAAGPYPPSVIQWLLDTHPPRRLTALRSLNSIEAGIKRNAIILDVLNYQALARLLLKLHGRGELFKHLYNRSGSQPKLTVDQPKPTPIPPIYQGLALLDVEVGHTFSLHCDRGQFHTWLRATAQEFGISPKSWESQLDTARKYYLDRQEQLDFTSPCAGSIIFVKWFIAELMTFRDPPSDARLAPRRIWKPPPSASKLDAPHTASASRLSFKESS